MPDRPDINSGIFRKHWETGFDFGLEKLRNQLLPVIQHLENEGKLGKVIADVGSGKVGVSSLIDFPDKKIVRVDLVADVAMNDNQAQMMADLRTIDNPPIGTKKQLAYIRNWLRNEGLQEGDKPAVDTMILSRVLNYIDYKQVLSQLAHYLKSNSRLIVFNKIDLGYWDAFSEKRPKNNMEVIEFLKQIGFESEIIQYDGVDRYASKFHFSGPEQITKGELLYVGRKLSDK